MIKGVKTILLYLTGVDDNMCSVSNSMAQGRSQLNHGCMPGCQDDCIPYDIVAAVTIACLHDYAKKPSFSPFFLASRTSPCTCLLSAPILWPKDLITWECKEIPLPRSWLNCFLPTAALTSFTAGTKIPLVDLFPIVVTWRHAPPEPGSVCRR